MTYIRDLMAVAVAAFAAYTDIKRRMITNPLMMSGAVLWLMYVLIQAAGEASIYMILIRSLAGAAVCGTLLFLSGFLGRGGLGMGDIKLFLFTGALYGVEGGLYILLLTTALMLAAAGLKTVIQKTKHGSSYKRYEKGYPMAPFALAGLLIYIAVSFFAK